MSPGCGSSLGTIAARASAVLACVAALAATASAPAPGDLNAVLREMEAQAPVLMNRDHVPGMAFAVVQGDQVVYARGFGYRDQDASSGLVDEHTLFEIGSTTKAFNAAVLGTIVDDGSVSWTDRVRDHLPDFKMHDPWVTKEMLVEDLISQRSGMPGYALDNMPGIGFDRLDVRRATRWVEPVTSFRAKFGYQNCMHLWAADLIEKKTGLAWEEAVRRRILEPLGMSESTFDFEVFDRNPNHAREHIPLPGGGLWTTPPDWRYRKWIAIYAPAGGLMSNVADMAKWVALQSGEGTYGGRVILKPETLQAIRAPRIYLGKDDIGVSSYAMGWVLAASPNTPVYWHNGATPGMHSIVMIYPEGRLGLVVLTNHPENRVPEDLARILLWGYFCGSPEGAAEVLSPALPTVLYDATPGHRTEAPVPALPEAAAISPRKLAGTYHNPAYGKAVVEREGDALFLSLGPDRVRGTLTPKGANVYTYAWPDWPGNEATVTFKADAAGEVAKLTITECGDVRGGEFRKRS